MGQTSGSPASFRQQQHTRPERGAGADEACDSDSWHQGPSAPPLVLSFSETATCRVGTRRRKAVIWLFQSGFRSKRILTVSSRPDYFPNRPSASTSKGILISGTRIAARGSRSNGAARVADVLAELTGPLSPLQDGTFKSCRQCGQLDSRCETATFQRGRHPSSGLRTPKPGLAITRVQIIVASKFLCPGSCCTARRS